MLDTRRNYAILNLESYDCNARSKTNTFGLDPLELILEICVVEEAQLKADGDQASFTGLVLGCIEAKFCKKICV